MCILVTTINANLGGVKLVIDNCPNCNNNKLIVSTEEEFHCGACGYVSDNIERDYYTVKFREELTRVLSLARGSKTSDYGEAWQRTGLVGIYIKLMIKEARLRSLVWEGNSPQVQGESIYDTLQDIVAYAVYGMLCLKDDNISGSKERKHHLEDMMESIKEELSCLER